MRRFNKTATYFHPLGFPNLAEERVTLASTTQIDVVSLIAEQIASGIEDAVAYWLGRIERELANSSLTANEQLRVIEIIVQEYKETTEKVQFRCAEA